MEYKIKRGDRFLCLDNYVMFDTDVEAYTKDKIYLSESDGCITDNEQDVKHEMGDQEDFFEHFLYLTPIKARNK